MIRFTPEESVQGTDADMIVNTVNTVGVMGAGVAKAVKDRYPAVMPPYQAACRSRKLYPGGVQLLRMGDGKIVVNLASKEHFSAPSKPAWSGFGLLNLSRVLSLPEMSGVRSVLLPPPGGGLGGLRPSMVQRMIRTYMAPHADRVDIRVSQHAADIPPCPVRYTGVGSRETPKEVMDEMRGVAEILADQEWILRSGNAIGADSAFESGSPLNLTESYLAHPKASVPHGIVEITPEHSRLFRSVYRTPSGGPAPATMKEISVLLMTRNGNQVFGPDFSNPSDVVICWTPYGDPVGGTRQAIALAKLIDIPIINLGDRAWRDARADDIAQEAMRLVQERRERMGIPMPSRGAEPAP